MSINEPAVAHRPALPGSERNLGITFALVLALFGAWPLVRGAHPRLWAIAIAIAFLAAALLRPRLLSPLNRVWFRVGLFLHRIINPVLMLFIYYGAIVPTGLILKALGKDLLRLQLDRGVQSYWIAREPPGPAPGSMIKQF